MAKKICSECGSVKITCMKCEWKWEPKDKTKDPASCPNCKCRSYDEPKRAYVKKGGG